MKTLLNLFNRPGRAAGTRFNRYYAEIARPGVGYPTADEARRDLLRHDHAVRQVGLYR